MEPIIQQLKHHEQQLKAERAQIHEKLKEVDHQLSQIKGAIRSLVGTTYVGKKNENALQKRPSGIRATEDYLLNLAVRTLEANGAMPRELLFEKMVSSLTEQGIPKHGVKAKCEKLMLSDRFRVDEFGKIDFA